MATHEATSNRRHLALVAALAAVLGIPFYMGLIHASLARMFGYAAVASMAMAVGQYADTPREERGDAHLFLTELGLWFVLIVLFGGMSYLLALIF